MSSAPNIYLRGYGKDIDSLLHLEECCMANVSGDAANTPSKQAFPWLIPWLKLRAGYTPLSEDAA
jgi:hypothetical protein